MWPEAQLSVLYISNHGIPDERLMLKSQSPLWQSVVYEWCSSWGIVIYSAGKRRGDTRRHQWKWCDMKVFHLSCHKITCNLLQASTLESLTLTGRRLVLLKSWQEMKSWEPHQPTTSNVIHIFPNTPCQNSIPVHSSQLLNFLLSLLVVPIYLRKQKNV